MSDEGHMRKPTSATYDIYGATVSYEHTSGSPAGAAKAEIKLCESSSMSFDGDPSTALRNISSRLREFAAMIDEIAKELETQR